MKQQQPKYSNNTVHTYVTSVVSLQKVQITLHN